MKWYLLPLYMVGEYLLITQNKIRYLFQQTPPESWREGKKGEVVLIQGVHERWVFLETIGDFLNKKGYKVHVVVELATNTMPVQNAYKKVEKYIVEKNLNNVILVTHSKGGIIGLELLKNQSIAKRIKKLITVACPYGGSWFAHVFPSTKELLPTSQLIKNVLSKVDSAKIVNFFPIFDNHVVPNRNLYANSVNSQVINAIGHTRILEAKELQDKVAECLNL